MKVLKIALLGFGTVGEGVYRTIQSHGVRLEEVLGKKVEVVAVLVRDKEKARNISKDLLLTTDFDEILNIPQLDIVMEAIVEKEPGFTYLKKAIQKGCHVITANKEMFAHHGKELLELAEQHHVSVGFEATVAGGVPIIQTLRQLLNVNRINKIQGILNGTSNFILSEMREKKQSFADALHLAQEKGYAENDPSNDVEGTDAFYKLVILSKIAFGQQLDWSDINVAGITKITSELVEEAEELGLRFKHIASVEQENGKLKGSVKPILVGRSHPFYHIEGVENAVNVEGDIVGSITLQGPGAGMFPTASAMIEDLGQLSKISKQYGSKSFSVKTNKETRRAAEYWLICNVKKKLLHPAIENVERLKNGTSIINADEKVVEKVREQYPGMEYFKIIGGYNEINRSGSTSLTATL
ncbi:MAG: homoserine dehydrogenase [Bacillota bacterium]|nr:homoserine dehydrogenase [Bacillota bacterium]